MPDEKPAAPDISKNSPEIPEAVVRPPRRVSLIWIVPVLALVLAGWLVWKQEQDKGPVVTITFSDARGVQAGKTPLIYRGITAGRVTDVRLNDTDSGVIMTVQLKKDAAVLAKEGTQYWVVHPELNLEGITGLETIVSGVYLTAYQGKGPAATTSFKGLDEAPFTPYAEAGLSIILHAENIESLQKGSPVYFRNIPVGIIESFAFDPGHNRILVHAYIAPKYSSLLKKSSRFYKVSGAKVSVGPGQIDLKAESLIALLKGGVAFDHFEDVDAPPAQDMDAFELHRDLSHARYRGTWFTVLLDDAVGVTADSTYIRCRGVPVGLVKKVEFEPGFSGVKLSCVLIKDMEGLLRADTRFRVVKPRADLRGVSGLETLVSGVYMELLPGTSSEPADTFTANSGPVPALATQDGLDLVVKADKVNVVVGAPVLYKGVSVGQVLDIRLAPDARSADLHIRIRPGYAPLVRSNSVFWYASGMRAWLGFLGIHVRADNLDTIAQGGLCLSTPDKPGAAVSPGTSFTLQTEYDEVWLKWNPKIAVSGE